MEIKLFLTSFLSSIILTPFVKLISERKKLGIAKTEDRKLHKNSTSQIGGLSIFLSFLVCLIFLYRFENIKYIFFLCFIIFLIGFIDDIRDLPAKIKFLFQIIPSVLFIVFCFKIHSIIGIIFVIFWIIGITNSINLIDGIDGLAVTISLISAFFFAIFSYIHRFELPLLLSIFIIGAGFGFLVFNFYPAKIFLGDSGAYFLGFLLSIISIISLFEKITFFNFIGAVLILGLPIVDTTYTIIRRIVQKRAVFLADKQHIHHKLLNYGFSQKKIALTLSILHFIFGFIGISVIL